MIYPWQESAWEQLGLQVRRMPHALLLHGPQGIGKLQLAERFAQGLLCESTDAGRKPCGSCEGCRWFSAGSHPDFRRVEPEALARPAGIGDDEEAAAPARAAKPSLEIKVDQVRALADFLNLKSHRDGPRIALVHPAESMNANAANALLKGLEEPPGRAMFVLVSHRPARLLATVRSRCVAVPVPIPDRTASLAWLGDQGLAEAASWLAFASGSPLQALQYASAFGATLGRRREALAARDLDALGAVNDREQLEELAEVLQKHALDKAFVSYCGRAKYGNTARSRDAVAWLRYARRLGRDRALARHPMNPRLFAAEMLKGLPEE
ncbi:MAG: DNA polymerase III subunit delta' [Betaproteobacteria bacterium]|nr:DNA polymerase III subunit delta' [Betaproteobacteria bacterium]MDH5578723.1 DNA polymerase III subunit delta' [Betaproteobacteria bacterium]